MVAVTKIKPRNIDVTGDYTVNALAATGNVTAANIKSDHLLYANGDPYVFTTNAAGLNSQIQFNNGNLFAGSGNLTFDISTNTLVVTNISANGAALTQLTGANVAGQVGYAAVANSVAGANVTGAVGLATYATTANLVAGANVSGEVSFAATANSVTGANVAGAVGLATYATTANSVAGANVSGEVANATYAITAGTAYSVSAANISGTINLANFAATANSVAGANVSGEVAFAAVANSVNGANVSGQVSYAAVANSVAGVNVSGTVNSANYATTANSVAGANVTGYVPSANTANVAFSVDGANVSGAVNLATYATIANYVVAANVSGTVASATVAASANSVAGANVTGEVNFAATANSVAGANVTGQVANALVAGTVTTNAQPNITSVGSLTTLDVTGNVVIGGNLIVSGTQTVINSTIVSVNDTAIVLANNATNATEANGAGIIINGANANVLYDSTSNAFAFSHPISANGALLSSLAGANVTGQVANALVAGTVYTSAQPSITSVGTLTSLNVSGNITLTGADINLGSVSNLHVDGGTAGYVLTTDGVGNLSWAAQTGGGSVADVAKDIFTANGSATSFELSVTPVANKYTTVHVDGVYQTSDVYTLTGNSVSFGETLPAGTIVEVQTHIPGSTSTAGTVTNSAQPNITSVGTLAGLTVSGNILPSANVTYNLGSPTNRFKDLYLSNNTIYLGNTAVSANSILPINLDIQPETLEIQIAAPGSGNDITWLWTWETSTLPFARNKITNSPEVNVPLYKQGTYTINNFANEQTGSMTQRHVAKLKWVDGSGLDNVVSWAVDAGNVSYSHPDINGGATTTVQRLNISVPANVTIPTLVAPNVAYDVSFANVGAYTIGNGGVGENRNLGPVYRGGTYTFNLSSTIADHPFYITTDNGTNFVANAYVGEYTSGVTGSRNNGTAGKTTLTFVVPQDAPDVLYYQCGVHASMRGAITIKNLAVETNVNGNYVLYLQHMKEGHKTPVEIRPLPSLVNQMCIVYDGSSGKFVPQDLATYVENTPSFKNKIREVAGTATLIAPNGVAVVPTVTIAEDASYLPLVGNKSGDIIYASDTGALYIWDGSKWNNTKQTVNKKYITMSQTGAPTLPFVGVARLYPTSNVTISNVFASVGTPSSGVISFSLLKNGTTVGTYTFSANAYKMTTTAANISVTTSDYLTLNITSGTGLTDLKVDLEYLA